MTNTMPCRICSQAANHAFNALLLFKYDAEFFYCDACGFLQTAEPHWLEEAYEDAVVAADTGVLQRNQTLAIMSAVLLYFLFPSKSRYLDYAGGYGLFVRLMRDIGFDFYWSDKYCENVFAQGFESKPGETFELVTTFEVLEHVSDPVEFIRDVLDKSGADSLLFSTELFAGDPPQPDQWWYYCFEAGQHISFFQRRTLEALAARLGRKLYSHGSVHLITSRTIPPLVFPLLTSRFLARALSFIPRLGMRSRTMADHENLIKQRR